MWLKPIKLLKQNLLGEIKGEGTLGGSIEQHKTKGLEFTLGFRPWSVGSVFLLVKGRQLHMQHRAVIEKQIIKHVSEITWT